jgi:preprotein translocase subunit SecY
MAVMFLILFPLLFASIWLFANYLPETKKRLAMQRYNRVLAVIALLSPLGVVAYYGYSCRQAESTASCAVLAILGSVLLVALILLFGTVLRMLIFDESNKAK